MANYSGEIFSYSKSKKLMVAEASDLLAFRVDSVFGIKSHKTGRTFFFCFMQKQTDADNDTVYWEYEPLGQDPETRGWKVRVYND